MDNMVEKNFSYERVRANSSDQVLFVFERLMESIELSQGVKVDNVYYSYDFTPIIGDSIPAPVLVALVNRGMLACVGKINGKNAYAITNEIYNYYKNTYKPDLERYNERMNRAFKNYLAITCRGDRSYEIKNSD